MKQKRNIFVDTRFMTESGELTDYGYDLCEMLAQYDNPYSRKAVLEVDYDFQTRFGGYCYVEKAVEHPVIKAIISYIRSRKEQHCCF